MSLRRTIALMALAAAGCGGGADEPVRSPTATEDPARAEQARLEDDELARKNQAAEAAFLRGAAAPESP